MIDLHLHTTASDGVLSPSALVERAFDVGIRILSVTDHDTMAGIEEASGAAVLTESGTNPTTYLICDSIQ